MTITKQNAFYIARTVPSEKELPRAAGFRWDPDKRCWWTKFIDKAAKFAAFADATCKDELNAWARQHQEALADSRASEAVADVHIPVPQGLAYLPYQNAGINYASKRFRAGQKSILIADEMGLGKTIQGIGIFNLIPEIKRVLIICPASLRLNWKREFEKWAARPVTVGIANGAFPTTDVVIVNYDILEKYNRELRSITWDLMLVDEAQYLKNPKAKRTQQVLGAEKYDKATKTTTWTLSPIPCLRSAFLTGTPLVNRPIELWPILHYADPTTWYNFMSFAKRYTDAQHNGFGWDFTGAANLPELQDKLRSTIMVRRLKADVLKELPAKRRQVIEIPAKDAAAKAALAAEKSAFDAYTANQAQLAALRELGRTLGYEAAL